MPYWHSVHKLNAVKNEVNLYIRKEEQQQTEEYILSLLNLQACLRDWKVVIIR